MADRKLTVTLLGDSRSLTKAFANAGKASKGFRSSMAKIGKIAAVGVAAAFGVMALALKRGFGEFMESQAVMAQTAAVLKSTGGVANVTAKHVDVLAGALSRMSSIDDEAIASSENMLLTFTNIRNGVGKGNKIFDAATLAVLDMSVAMGKDLNSTAIMVGKALNDTTVNAKGTITGWSALRRVGVMISPVMMKMAAAFIKAGKPMEAQKLLLKELGTEFGGSAKAFGLTLTGQFNKLRNATDEVTGAFAEGLAPVVQRVVTLLTNKMANPAFVARVRELGKLVGEKLYSAFVAVGTWFQANWPAIQGGFRTLVKIIRTIVGVVKTVNYAVDQLFLGILAGVSGIIEAFTHLPFVGDKFKGALGAVNAQRERIRASHQEPPSAPRRGKKEMPGGGYAPGRAFGGPVMPGVSYRVGERGPETLTMGRSSGHISPNGAGAGVLVTGDITLQLDKSTVARITLKELQRMAGSNASSRRGRYGGTNLALG